MKTRRFFSSFFAVLLCALILTAPAMAAEADKKLEDPAVQAKAALLIAAGSRLIG